MSVAFRYAGLDEYPRISAFLSEYWAPNHIYVRSRELFDWTFTRKSHWTESGYSFALAEEGDDIVGILGGIPFDFNAFGKSSRGVWIVNYAVRPDHRKGPTAFTLLSMFRRETFPVVIACGLNPDTTVIYRVLRGLVLPEMPRHFVVLPGAEERVAAMLQLAYPEWSGERSLALAKAFRGEPAEDVPEDYATDPPPSWDQADWPKLATQTIGAARDTDYLNWRYRHHPSFQYHFLSVPDGRRSGLAVWRLETIVRHARGYREQVDKIARLVEFLPASEANAGQLLRAFFQQVRKHGAMAADYYGYHSSSRALLKQNGFPGVESHPDGRLLPSRFQPLDGHGGTMLNAMFLRNSLPDCTVEAECPWYWTKSDSDQDRPN